MLRAHSKYSNTSDAPNAHKETQHIRLLLFVQLPDIFVCAHLLSLVLRSKWKARIVSLDSLVTYAFCKVVRQAMYIHKKARSSYSILLHPPRPGCYPGSEPVQSIQLDRGSPFHHHRQRNQKGYSPWALSSSLVGLPDLHPSITRFGVPRGAVVPYLRNVATS